MRATDIIFSSFLKKKKKKNHMLSGRLIFEDVFFGKSIKSY